MQKTKIGSLCYTRWIKYFNGKLKNKNKQQQQKTLEGNLGNIIQDMGMCKDLMTKMSKEISTKAKINK